MAEPMLQLAAAVVLKYRRCFAIVSVLLSIMIRDRGVLEVHKRFLGIARPWLRRIITDEIAQPPILRHQCTLSYFSIKFGIVSISKQCAVDVDAAGSTISASTSLEILHFE